MSVTVFTRDGNNFTEDQAVFEKCKTLKNLMEDVGTENPIPIGEVDGPIFSRVVSFAKNSQDQQWLEQFRQMDNSTLFSTILASNYLDYAELLDFCCSAVASMIRGKSPEEIRAHFGIKNDFTAEEQEQIRKENEWAE